MLVYNTYIYMNNKQQRLAEKCANLIPLEGRVLVALNKVRTYKDKTFKSTPVDPNIRVEDIVAGETEMSVEEVESNVNYRYQSAVVLRKTVDEKRFEVGDTVLFELGAIQDFDYVKGVSILNKYDVRFVATA